MIDPLLVVVLTRQGGAGPFKDVTRDVVDVHHLPGGVAVTFKNSKVFTYGRSNICLLQGPIPVPLTDGARVEVSGKACRPQTVSVFDGPGERWVRLFFADRFLTVPERDVNIIQNGAATPRGRQVMAYWRSIVAALPAGDALQRPFRALQFVHPQSVLARYLNGEPVIGRNPDVAMILPFRSNRSQRDAVQAALHHDISVIQGPPGTGKTQTILNFIATAIQTPGVTVGVVSFGNSAVDNIVEKLIDERFDYVVANLGKAEKRENFFNRQAVRNAHVASTLATAPPPAPTAAAMVELSGRLEDLQRRNEALAVLREELAAYQLEQQHFRQFFDRQELPPLGDVPLLGKSPDRILEYLANTQLVRSGGALRRLADRVSSYLKFGPTANLDANDTTVVLQLQLAYYDRRIDELRGKIAQSEARLTRGNFEQLQSQYQQLSHDALRAALYERYHQTHLVTYDQRNYRGHFRQFAVDYPVILSTCHSLGDSLAPGQLLDYLIIDEASQVDLLTGALALARCRNLIVVGDPRQLPHIPNTDAAARVGAAPAAAQDYVAHSILSSMGALYGQDLPRTMLKEHYRCDPDIIGFCNKKFYDGALIPFTVRTSGTAPMTVVLTAPGNHLRRQHGGGYTNEREVDIALDQINVQCAGTAREDIGIATPYRKQADKMYSTLKAKLGVDAVQADTVHRFQGREKDVVILSTVLDGSWRGKLGMKFVDDPQLINVAVSRAAKRFILVTDNGKFPDSRNLRDLIDYIHYHNPAGVTESPIISVFDLLYKDYSKQLEPLAHRLVHRLKYKSENIILTVLDDLLKTAEYADYTVAPQVLLRNLLPDLARLTPDQAAYVKHRASVDFAIYNRITNRLAFVIEVNGFAFHEFRPAQVTRDDLKKAIFDEYDIKLLTLATTGSDEENRIRAQFDADRASAP